MALLSPTTFKKVIISGDVIEVYEYEKMPYQLANYKNDESISDVEWIKEYDKELDKRYEDLSDEIKHLLSVVDGRMGSSITRTRNMIRRLILANFDNGSKFVTLTFKENITELSEANKYFDRFIKRMRRKYAGFKYIAVVEFQKRGAVHYHMLSDLPYIKASEMEQLWGNGFIKINRITHVDNVGAYVIKYMTKDMSDIRLFNSKAYNASKGLQKPVTVRGELAEEIHRMYGNAKEVFTNSYTSEYLGQVTYKEYNLKRIDSEQ